MRNRNVADTLPDWFYELSEEEKKQKVRRLRLEDNCLLYQIAMDTLESLSVRRMAVLGTKDQELLCRIAKLCDEDKLRESAAHRVFKLDADFPESKERRCVFRVESYLFLRQAIEEKDNQFLEYIARTNSGTVRHNAILALPVGYFPELDDDTALHYLTASLAERENDIPLLMEAAVNGPHRRFAFARLTGKMFYEPCDSYSHCTYECGQAEGVTDKQIKQTCCAIIENVYYDETLVSEARKTLTEMDNDAEQKR